MGVKCFLVTDSGRDRLTLRRYSHQSDCPVRKGAYHNANGPLIAVIDAAPFKTVEGYTDTSAIEKAYKPPLDDSRWPVKCDNCDRPFDAADPYQLFSDSIYVDAQGGEHSLRDETPGMMWDAWWMGEYSKGPDGKCLVVNCPNGHQWMIDGPASNCTMKNDTGPYGKAHRCWIRHGTPPLITVDKAGKTCAAGAGSIQAGNYHGFLRNGEFVSC